MRTSKNFSGLEAFCFLIYAELTEFRNGLLETRHLAAAILHYLLTAENAKPLTAEYVSTQSVVPIIDQNWLTEVAGN